MQKSTNLVLSLPQVLKAAVSNQDDDSIMATIAENNGFNINTLRSSINPTTTTHKANIHHFEAILSHTQDPRIMDTICAIHGNAGWFEFPEICGTSQDVLMQIGKLAQEQGDLSVSVVQALSDKVVTHDEYAKVHKDALDLVRVAVTLLRMVEKYKELSDET